MLIPFFFCCCEQCSNKHEMQSLSLGYMKSIAFGYIPTSRIGGYYCNSVFNFFESIHTVFHKVCINLYAHQQHMSSFCSISSLALVIFTVYSLSKVQVILISWGLMGFLVSILVALLCLLHRAVRPFFSKCRSDHLSSAQTSW
jgi:hypothetical protein